MAAVGIGLGIFVFLLVSAFTSEYITKPDNTAGCLPGLIAAIWVAWPCFHHAGVSRYNFLHPVPKEYNTPIKHAFAQIRDIISDISYNFGDKWHVSTADVNQRRILATLRFTEEESHLEGTSLQNIHSRKERVQRLLEMEVQFKDNGNDTTTVQFDFHPKVEGVQWYACDSIVNGLMNRVEATLGAGTDRGQAADTKLGAPPWWLIGLGALGVLNLGSSIMTAVFK
ncbi:MAG: hypothetical protein IT342_22625 [Candidatus Melainabacteria bacterium]|nr:hypothetical protein [Candidatus Melainabacteria bacterium]